MLFASVALLVLPSFVLSQALPNTSPPSKVGDDCTLSWTLDASGTWKAMTIEFMTGANLPMTHMRTIAQNIDATKVSNFTWTCPDVTPNAAIYFYQFSIASDPAHPQWATRSLIAAADGSETEPTLVGDDGVPYGIGTFVDPSLYNAKPAWLANNDQLTGGASASSGTGSASTSAPAAPAASASTPAASASAAASSPAASASSPAASASAAASSAGGSTSATGSRISTSASRTASATGSAASSTSTTPASGAGASAVLSWGVLVGAAFFGAVASSI